MAPATSTSPIPGTSGRRRLRRKQGPSSLADFGEGRAMRFRRSLAETAEEHPLGHIVSGEERTHGCDRAARRPIRREAVDAGADGGKSDAVTAVALRQVEGDAIARRQQFVLATVATAPDGTDGMDDALGGKAIALGEFRLPSGTAAEQPTFVQQLRAGGAVDGAVDAAAA